eukprot:COSAG01_NODE_29328_length_640_cov_1.007394_1_plen_105_part_10
MVAPDALMLNTRYSGRYGTRARTSHQGTARRDFTVLETAHSIHNYKHGEVIRVLDHGDNTEKTWYVSRLFAVEGLSDDELVSEGYGNVKLLVNLVLSRLGQRRSI